MGIAERTTQRSTATLDTVLSSDQLVLTYPEPPLTNSLLLAKIGYLTSVPDFDNPNWTRLYRNINSNTVSELWYRIAMPGEDDTHIFTNVGGTTVSTDASLVASEWIGVDPLNPLASGPLVDTSSSDVATTPTLPAPGKSLVIAAFSAFASSGSPAFSGFTGGFEEVLQLLGPTGVRSMVALAARIGSGANEQCSAQTVDSSDPVAGIVAFAAPIPEMKVTMKALALNLTHKALINAGITPYFRGDDFSIVLRLVDPDTGDPLDVRPFGWRSTIKCSLKTDPIFLELSTEDPPGGLTVLEPPGDDLALRGMIQLDIDASTLIPMGIWSIDLVRVDASGDSLVRAIGKFESSNRVTPVPTP